MRIPTKIYKRAGPTGFAYFIDCEDGYSTLAIWPDQMCGYVPLSMYGTWLTSWLDLLVVTGVTEDKVREALASDLSAIECEDLFWST